MKQAFSYPLLSPEINAMLKALSTANQQLIAQRRKLLDELRQDGIEYPLFISLGAPVTAEHQAVVRQFMDAQRQESRDSTYRQFEFAIDGYRHLARLNATLIFQLDYYQKLKEFDGVGGYRLDGSAGPSKPESGNAEH